MDTIEWLMQGEPYIQYAVTGTRRSGTAGGKHAGTADEEMILYNYEIEKDTSNPFHWNPSVSLTAATSL